MQRDNRLSGAGRSARGRVQRGSGALRMVAGGIAGAVVWAGVGLGVGLGQAAAAPLAIAPVVVPGVAPVAEFLAPRCAGTTTQDPADPTAHDGLDNLLSVSGARLEAYNAGGVVPLYDATGRTEDAPLCGTRRVVGADGTAEAVSQWMFCTAWTDDLCGAVDETGQAMDSTGAAVGPMEQLAGNPDLTGTDAERLIAYLIQNGHSFAATGTRYQFGGTTEASADGSSESRRALQALVWCISDLDTIHDRDFEQMCRLNLPAEEQARLLTLIPANPVIDLALATPGETYEVGEVARVTLMTNVVAQPITLTASPLGAFEVCSDGATLADSVLTVDPPADGAPGTVRIELCATATVPGPVSVTLSATPASLLRMSWNRSASTPPALACQVFAAFEDVALPPVTTTARSSFVVAPVVDPVVAPVVAPVVDPVVAPVVDPLVAPVVDPLVDPVVDPLVGPSVTPTTDSTLRVDPTQSAPATVVHAAGRSTVVAEAGLAYTGTDPASMVLLAGASGLAGILVLAAASRGHRRRG